MACSIDTAGTIQSSKRRAAVFRFPGKHALTDGLNIGFVYLSGSSHVQGNKPAIAQ
jgi:hypothetical protein